MAKVYFIIITILLAQGILFSQNQSIKFDHLTPEDGLPSGGVDWIIQDQKGMMWFATLDGLVKYDGYNFVGYKNIPGDSTSLSHNIVNVVYEDQAGQIWAGTRRGGLCRLDRETDSFIRYFSQRNDSTSLCSNYIVSIFESKTKNQNTLWIGTGYGLNKYIPETNDFKRYYPDVNKEGIKTNVNYIYSIIQDSSENVWIGTFNEGLYSYDSEADSFNRYKAKKEFSGLFKNKDLFKLCAIREEDQDVIWFGTFRNGLYKINITTGQIKHYLNESGVFDYGIYALHAPPSSKGRILWLGNPSGLFKFDTKNEKCIIYKNEPGNSASLSSSNVQIIMEDKYGILWIGSSGGIDIVDPQHSNFTTFQANANLKYGLGSRGVKAICETEVEGQRVLYIGTMDGLYKYVRETGKFTPIKHDPENNNSLSSDIIGSLLISQHSTRSYLWASTSNGLNRINLITGKIKRYYVPDKNTIFNIMHSLREDEKGRIWIGTQSNFLISFDPETEIFTKHSSPRIAARTLCFDSFGNLWMGAQAGAGKFHLKSERFTRYKHKQNDPKSLSSNVIITIIEDKRKVIWIGTDNGLNRYDHDTETFSLFTIKDGLPSNVITGILEDDRGNLWLCTDKGISKFNPVKKTFKNYDSGDGLLEDYCWERASYKNNKSEMFIGCNKGFTMFHPDKLIENKNIPPIIISDFQIFNKSIQPGKNSVLMKEISYTREINLPYDLSVFSFEFAALDYFNPQKNQYAYKMEGVDPEWVYTDASRRFATYTSLEPGDYTFKVKGSNNDRIWNEEGTSIKVTILPPWWRTNLAYFVYLILFGFTLYLIWYFQMKRIRIKHALEMEHIQAEKYQEIDRLKSHFFANISHEFRTPLTLILSPVEQLLKKTFKGNIEEGFITIRSNAKKLLRLVNQLLSLSKLEAGQMRLQVSKQDIIPVFKRIINLFSSLAERNKIDFNFAAPKSMIMFFDEEKIEIILNNLVSNAFKFTPEGGMVEVEVSKEHTPNPSREGINRFPSTEGWPENRDGVGQDFLQITVSNTGSHIPEDQLDKIVDRFYQGD